MYPAPFAYHAPSDLDEAVALLAGLAETKVLAGGQSLIPLMNLGLARPPAVVDINGLPGLDTVAADGGDGGQIRIGALVRHRTLETSPAIRARCPLLADAAALIGNIRVRHRGTVGGSLAHADPAAELPLAAVALDAVLEVRGPDGCREVGAADFFRGYLLTDLAPAELVVGVRVSTFGPTTVYGLAELVRRAGDFALVAACAVLDLDGGGGVRRAALALGGVGPHPIRAREAEAVLVARGLGGDAISAAAEAAARGLAPESDVHASAAYRRAMARVMARRALEAAKARART
jgi:carbon-monoxide dehydrogenase medium subunit